ncbi:hypothetical protein QFZ63_006832 [Streptomyces sp. B3I7]|nr:hypothetical protein [Streptomyces sp. B3I8]MDQ0815118.1 hypothetical protein [Streptomyces sp. B3I7]
MVDAKLPGMDELEFMRGRVYGADPEDGGPRPGRTYAQLVGGPLDGLLLDVTEVGDATDAPASGPDGGIALPTEIGRFGPGGRAQYAPRPDDPRRFDWHGDLP